YRAIQPRCVQGRRQTNLNLTGPWAFGMTRAATRRSTAVQPLVAVNGRFLADELELATQTRLSSFSKAARRSAKKYSCFASTKQPFEISSSRPTPAIRFLCRAAVGRGGSL
ncbi:MAG: hypothetical protein QMB52_10645, partial [Propionivibrio sp.]